jgi:hypothetical protein
MCIFNGNDNTIFDQIILMSFTDSLLYTLKKLLDTIKLQHIETVCNDNISMHNILVEK